MSNNSLEVFHADADMELFLDLEYFEVEVVYGNRGLQWLLKNICDDKPYGNKQNVVWGEPFPSMTFSV